MNEITTTYGAGTLLGIAGFSVLLLLVLIMRFKIHAFLALTLVSVATALLTGVQFDNVVPTLLGGFGSTLAGVALLVGLGAMIGRLLEISGGAKVLADTLVSKFGSHRAPLALSIASLLFGFPIFFDAGLVVMLPIIFSVAKQFGGSTLKYALPAAGAFAVMHALLPPHPGPVAAAELLGANIGLLVVVGLAIALPAWYTGAYLFGLYAGKKFHVPLPSYFAGKMEIDEHHQPPSFAMVLAILMLPLVMIFMDTGLNTATVLGWVSADSSVVQLLRMLGKTPIALLITVFFALVAFSGKHSRQHLEKVCDGALGPICGIILVTGAGGMFGGVLRASGIGDALAGVLTDTGMPVIVAAFVIAAALRVAQGSATVALTTAAALISPLVAATPDVSQFDLCFIVIAIAGGATVLSHVNDSGFWLVGRFLQMDEKTTLKTWTVMETLIGTSAFLFALVGSIIL